MNTVVTINGVPYTALQRAQNNFGLDALELFLNGYDAFEMHEFGAPPTPSIKRGWPVTVAVDGTTLFTGWFTSVQTGDDVLGWKHGYRAQGRRWYVDRFVPVTGTDGTGDYQLNTPPEDVYGVPTDRGLTVGTILRRLLTVQATAQRLNAIGVGNYASLTPPTLPASTLADLALLTAVPPIPAVFSGKGMLSQVGQFVSHWMPRFATQLQPDGTIRFKDTTDIGVGKTFVPRTFTLASMYGDGDPIHPRPTIKTSIEDIATNFQVRGGPEVEAQILSLVDGTLAEGFTSTNKTNWRYTYFTNPSGAEDHGTITLCTSTSATIQSADATVSWAINFWNSNQGVVFLGNTAADTSVAGVTPYVFRQITSCDAMSPGGTATVHWDATWPTAENDFNAYRIVGNPGGIANTWRLYLPRDPLSGHTGLNTVIGQHMVRKSPIPINWSNKTTTIGEYYTQAVVVGPGGASFPIGVEPQPALGGYLFDQPTVAIFGNPARLNKGSPTTTNDGLPADIQVFALYSTHALTSVYPPNDTLGNTVYQGTASDTWKVTEYIDVPGWTWANNAADMAGLAQEYFKASSDVVYDVSLNWLVCRGNVPSWSFLTFDWCLNVAISGTTSPWSAINCTVTSIKINWQGTPVPQVLSFSASNQKTPFTGDELYTHPQFSGTSALTNATGNSLGGLFGSDYMPAQEHTTPADVIGHASDGVNRAAAESFEVATSSLEGNLAFGESLGTSRGDGDQFTAQNAHKQFDADGGRIMPDVAQGTGFRDANAAVPGQADTTPTDKTQAYFARMAREANEADERGQIKDRNDLNQDPNPRIHNAEANMARASRKAGEQYDKNQIKSNQTTRDMLSEATGDGDAGSDTAGGG